MKFILGMIRVAILFLLFTAISNQWSIGVQYLISIVTCLVWAVTGYIEGLKSKFDFSQGGVQSGERD